MKLHILLFALMLGLISPNLYAAAGKVSVYKYKTGRKIPGNVTINGTVNVKLKHKINDYGKVINTTSDYFGIDLHGFARIPHEVYVLPLKAAHFRWGGNLHSTYNWKENTYYDEDEEDYFQVYATVDRRVRQIQQKYSANPLVQVNLMGWQPTKEDGLFVLRRSADAALAAEELFFLNLEKKVALIDVLVGNEPFLWKETHGKIWKGETPSADEYIERFVSYVISLRDAQEKISGNANDINIWGPEMATSWVDWQTMNPKDCVRNDNIPQKFICSYGNGEFDHFIPYFLSKLVEFEHDDEVNPKGYKLLDYLSFHYYPLFRTDFDDRTSIIVDKNGREDVAAMLESTNIWNKTDYINKYDRSSPLSVNINLVQKFKSWRDSQYPTAKLAITEFGVDSDDTIQYNPIVRPLYLADTMGRIRNAGIDIFVKSFLNNGCVDDKNGWSLIDNKGQKTALYNIYQLFSNNFLGQSLNVTDTFGDKVNAYSVFSEKILGGQKVKYINVFIVNKKAKDINIKLKLTKESTGLDRTALELKLTPWSLTLVQIPTNKSLRVIVKQYGAKEMMVPLGDYEEK